jgi:hypothetical protein
VHETRTSIIDQVEENSAIFVRSEDFVTNSGVSSEYSLEENIWQLLALIVYLAAKVNVIAQRPIKNLALKWVLLILCYIVVRYCNYVVLMEAVQDKLLECVTSICLVPVVVIARGT